MYCHAHPHKIARRKCRHCKQPLCPRCQILHDGVIFCSSLCRWSYFLESPRQLPPIEQIINQLKVFIFLSIPQFVSYYQIIKPFLSFLDKELSYWEERLPWELKASRDSLKLFRAVEKEGLSRIALLAQKASLFLSGLLTATYKSLSKGLIYVLNSQLILAKGLLSTLYDLIRRGVVLFPKAFTFLLRFLAASFRGLIKGLAYALKSQITLAKGLFSVLYTFIRLVLVFLMILIWDFIPWIIRKIFGLIYQTVRSQYQRYKNFDAGMKSQWWARAFARALLLVLILSVFSLSRSVMKAHKIYENLIATTTLALKSPPLITAKNTAGPEIPPAEPKISNPAVVSTAKPAFNNLPAYPPDVMRVATEEKIMSLTFDGGAEANVTQEILSALKDKKVRATIFLTGEHMKKYPHFVRRMIQEGHEIGNHTMTHPHLTTYARNFRHDLLPQVNKQYFQKELLLANQVFKSIAGRDLWPYWRAPYGEHNPTLRAWAQEVGYQHIHWSVDYQNRESMDSVDWVTDKNSRLYRSSEEIKQRLLAFGEQNGQGARGGIILMHLGTNRQEDRVHERLEEIIDAFREKGYRLVTISELLQSQTLLKTALKKSSLNSPY